MKLKNWLKVGIMSYVGKAEKSRKGIQVVNFGERGYAFEFWNHGRPQERRFFKTKSKRAC